MCGRTCCTLSPDLLPFACSTVTKHNGKTRLPKWNDAAKYNECKESDNSVNEYVVQNKYMPGTNISPTSYTPVMLLISPYERKNNSIQTESESSSDNPSEPEFILESMMWGLIPPWHKSDSPKGHGLTTNNARIETIKESKLYRPSLETNKRCVVICDGFYEWKTFKDQSKQPYLIYAKQNHDQSPTNDNGQDNNIPQCYLKNQKLECLSNNWKEDYGWTGQKPLFMAGIYSKWNPNSSGNQNTLSNTVYSYTIITRESGSTMKWIHHRMPLFLFNSDDVSLWLDPKIPSLEALDILHQRQDEEKLSWHPVSPSVGSVKNHGSDLMEKVDLGSDGKAINKSTAKSSNLMMSWLKPKIKSENRGDDKTNPANDEKIPVSCKKPKLE